MVNVTESAGEVLDFSSAAAVSHPEETSGAGDTTGHLV